MNLKETLMKWFKLDGLVNSLTGYIEARMELFKYEIREEVASAVARFALVLLVLTLGGLTLFTASLALSFKLSEYYGFASGFSITASVYMLLLLVLIIFRKKFSAYFERIIKSQLTSKN